jgi:peptidyl-prolyl cis-trans isomerase SurA
MSKRLHLAIVLWLAAATLAGAGETIDRIVAVVSGHPVMESQLIEGLHFEQFLANRPPQAVPVQELRAVLGRLVDQILLTQQMDAASFQQTSPQEIQERVAQIRKQSPAAASDQEWLSWLQSHDLTQNDLAERIGQQLRTVRFIEARFRPIVRVEPSAVETYYKEQLLPQMKQAGAQPVPLQQVAPRIREILVQQRLDDLLEEWLKTLRTQAEIRLPVPSSALVEAKPVARSLAAEVR